MKFVITGGPCSGKTTLIKALKKKGYKIIPETALFLIEKENRGANKIYPWTNIKSFVKRVFKHQMSAELKAKDKVFLDRSIIDAMAYCRMNNINVPKKYINYAKHAKYHRIFVLDMLPEKYWHKTMSGKPRMHAYKLGLEIHKINTEIYNEFGYPILLIPFANVSKRIKIIEKNI